MSNSEDAFIYFSALRRRRDEHKDADSKYSWYVIGNDTKDGECLTPVFPPHPSNRMFSACAAVGSKIYIIGGQDVERYTIYNDVYYIDILQPALGWVKGPSTKKTRSIHHAATMDGKIYVVGCCYDNLGYFIPCAEVLDPSENRWRLLQHELGMVLSPVSGHAVSNDGRQILFHSPVRKSLFSYYVKNDVWFLNTNNFGPFEVIAELDGILYCCGDDGVLYGYDASSPETSPKPVMGLGEVFYPCGLVRIADDKLCAISSRFEGDRSEHCRIFCVRFRVSKLIINSSGELEFVANSLSSSSYLLEYSSNFVDCLAIFPHQLRRSEDKDHGSWLQCLGEVGTGDIDKKKKKKKRKKKGGQVMF